MVVGGWVQAHEVYICKQNKCWGFRGAHVHDVCALVEDIHIGLQDIKMKGWGEHAPVTDPFLPTAQK